MIRRPKGDREKYMLFTLLMRPDGRWGVVYYRQLSREPKEALGVFLDNDASSFRTERQKLYEAAKKVR